MPAPPTDNRTASFADLTLAWFGEPLRMKEVFARVGVADPLTTPRRRPAPPSSAPGPAARDEGSPADPT
ncbi:MAG: hypothetical protein ABSG64_11945 [Solirubrobacteraceae bacterium]